MRSNIKSLIKKFLPKQLLKLINNRKYFPRSIKGLFYRVILKNSIFVSKSEISMASISADKTMETVIHIYRPKSILDLGCEVGKAIDFFSAYGIDVLGVEGSSMLINEAKNSQFIHKYNLEQELNLNKKFDLIWSYEFVEHIHPKYIETLLKTSSNHSDNIVMTAAFPGQGGAGHFNEQPSEYWIDQFSKYGYACNWERTNILRNIKEWFNQNILVFER